MSNGWELKRRCQVPPQERKHFFNPKKRKEPPSILKSQTRRPRSRASPLDWNPLAARQGQTYQLPLSRPRRQKPFLALVGYETRMVLQPVRGRRHPCCRETHERRRFSRSLRHDRARFPRLSGRAECASPMRGAAERRVRKNGDAANPPAPDDEAADQFAPRADGSAKQR